MPINIVVFIVDVKYYDEFHRESFTIPAVHIHIDILLLPILSFFFSLFPFISPSLLFVNKQSKSTCSLPPL